MFLWEQKKRVLRGEPWSVKEFFSLRLEEQNEKNAEIKTRIRERTTGQPT